MFDIVRYTHDRQDEWNRFVAQSKNGTFLFDRRYMDYHADRFDDCSLMIYDDGRLYALLPACDDGEGTLWSHRGLTYGGLIMSDRCRAAGVRDVFVALNDTLRRHRFQRVVYKHIPWPYAARPAEEDLFALSNVCHAALRSRDVASVVDLHRRLAFSTLRRRGAKKAKARGLCVEQMADCAAFWAVLEENLMSRFGAHPVHSLSEISLLRNRFPQNILLFGVFDGEQLLGGTVLYVTPWVVKTQYISANAEGKRCGALDLLFSTLLDRYEAAGWRFFDFGTSNLVDTDDLNDSLIFQKEGFGGRAVCYDTYEWRL